MTRLTIRLLDADNPDLRLLVSTNKDPEQIRKTLRNACAKRRTLISTDIPTFLPDFIAALRKLGPMRLVHQEYPTEITYAIQYGDDPVSGRKMVMLRIIRKNAKGDLITITEPFFAWLTGKERPRPYPKGNTATRRRERMAARAAADAARTGEDGHKRYDPIQQRLQENFKKMVSESNNKSIAASLRHGRKKKLKKYTLDAFPKITTAGPDHIPARSTGIRKVRLDFSGVGDEPNTDPDEPEDDLAQSARDSY